jgi:hypothetical protein
MNAVSLGENNVNELDQNDLSSLLSVSEGMLGEVDADQLLESFAKPISTFMLSMEKLSGLSEALDKDTTYKLFLVLQEQWNKAKADQDALFASDRDEEDEKIVETEYQRSSRENQETHDRLVKKYIEGMIRQHRE